MGNTTSNESLQNTFENIKDDPKAIKYIIDKVITTKKIELLDILKTHNKKPSIETLFSIAENKDNYYIINRLFELFDYSNQLNTTIYFNKFIKLNIPSYIKIEIYAKPLINITEKENITYKNIEYYTNILSQFTPEQITEWFEHYYTTPEKINTLPEKMKCILKELGVKYFNYIEDGQYKGISINVQVYSDVFSENILEIAKNPIKHTIMKDINILFNSDLNFFNKKYQPNTETQIKEYIKDQSDYINSFSLRQYLIVSSHITLVYNICREYIMNKVKGQHYEYSLENIFTLWILLHDILKKRGIIQEMNDFEFVKIVLTISGSWKSLLTSVLKVKISETELSKLIKELQQELIEEYIVQLNTIILESPKLKSDLVMFRAVKEMYWSDDKSKFYALTFNSTTFSVNDTIIKNFTDKNSCCIKRIKLKKGCNCLFIALIDPSQNSALTESLLPTTSIYTIINKNTFTKKYCVDYLNTYDMIVDTTEKFLTADSLFIDFIDYFDSKIELDKSQIKAETIKTKNVNNIKLNIKGTDKTIGEWFNEINKLVLEFLNNTSFGYLFHTKQIITNNLIDKSDNTIIYGIFQIRYLTEEWVNIKIIKDLDNIIKQQPQNLSIDFYSKKNELKVLSLNIQMFEKMTNEYELANYISSFDADVICLQEDLYQTEYPLGWMYKHTPYKLAIQYNVRHLSNSIYVKHIELVTDTRVLNLSINTSYFAPRCATIITYMGVKIANTHLTGGRYDDKWYNMSNIKGEQIKSRQIKFILTENPDIIVGDFNGEPTKSDSLDVYPLFEFLNKNEQNMFLSYWTAGHSDLINSDYLPVKIYEYTSIYNNNPDWIYYNSNKIELVTKKPPFVAKFFGSSLSSDYSDHNAIIASFRYKN